MWLERQIDIEVLERFCRHKANEGSHIATVQEVVRCSIFTIAERDEEEDGSDDEDREEDPEPVKPVEMDNQPVTTENDIFDLEERSIRLSSFGGENLLNSL